MRKYGFSVILKTHNTLKISDCLSQENLKKNNFYTWSGNWSNVNQISFFKTKVYIISNP